MSDQLNSANWSNKIHAVEMNIFTVCNSTEYLIIFHWNFVQARQIPYSWTCYWQYCVRNVIIKRYLSKLSNPSICFCLPWLLELPMSCYYAKKLPHNYQIQWEYPMAHILHKPSFYHWPSRSRPLHLQNNVQGRFFTAHLHLPLQPLTQPHLTTAQHVAPAGGWFIHATSQLSVLFFSFQQTKSAGLGSCRIFSKAWSHTWPAWYPTRRCW